MRFATLFLAGTALFLASCDKSPVTETDDGGSVSSDANSETETDFVKFHPQKEFCVEYENSGMMKGTSINCMRKWGTERVEIEDFEIGVGGFSKREKAHKTYIGDQIYVINTDKMTGTVTRNPVHKDLSNTDPIALGKAMMASWNMKDTGKDKTIAGVECNVMDSPQMGSVCLTDNLVMLEQSFMGVNRVATSVDLNSGGDDANYSLFEKAEMTEGPDIDALMKQI